MKCPYCGDNDTKVLDSRESTQSNTRRRRECNACNKRFTTYESVELGLTKIKKRSGKIVDFDQSKITEAIFKAAKAVGGENRKLAELLTEKIVEKLKENYNDENVPDVETVQDVVEKILIENGNAKTAKCYILYRDQHKKIRDTRKTFLEVADTMGEYLQRSDWRVNENSNVDFSLGGLILYSSGKMTANYWLNHVYPPEVADSHVNGDLHIHDLSMFCGYCAGWSLKQLLVEGFGGVRGQVRTKPAKHMDTVIGQVVNFLGTLQNEWAGAQAFSSFDTYLAPFAKADNMSYKEVKQCMQNYMFHSATPSRWGTQTPFLNLTFDWVVPEDMKDQKAIVGGKEADFTYGDCQKEMDLINKAFIETMLEGDAAGRVFTFPIPTYNITNDFDWNSENANLLFKMTAKYGIPYFQNFINSDLKPSDVRSMCCRLQMDLRELRNKTGGLFGSGESTGSIGVVTINVPRLGYISNSKEEFFQKLEKVMNIASESLEIKRKAVTKSMDNGLLPYTKRYLGNLDHHFSTIGLVGMNEACTNLLDKNIATEEGKKFAVETLEFMRNKLKQYQEETGHLYNLEATPAEGTSYRLARIDKKKFPEIKTAGKEEAFYTNSTQLPVDHTEDIFDALDFQDELQTKYTGGTVFHGFVGEQINSIEACKQLVKNVANSYKMPYFTVTPTFSVCAEHGYLKGKQETCPTCGNETEVYSRVVGYIRPVKSWNKGKKEEFAQRMTFSMPELTVQNAN
ncbi:MAG: ribonucleoside triphosphate reductase [Nanoarchaeota archaeon]|nr:ribonucleoside triphosphate reductase [Nanoarchaeota archaeon]